MTEKIPNMQDSHWMWC